MVKLTGYLIMVTPLSSAVLSLSNSRHKYTDAAERTASPLCLQPLIILSNRSQFFPLNQCWAVGLLRNILSHHVTRELGQSVAASSMQWHLQTPLLVNRGVERTEELIVKQMPALVGQWRV